MTGLWIGRRKQREAGRFCPFSPSKTLRKILAFWFSGEIFLCFRGGEGETEAAAASSTLDAQQQSPRPYQLWLKEREWDEPNLPANIKSAWNTWEEELPNMNKIKISRCYSPLDKVITTRELHVFCDASEKAYGSVAYLREVNEQGYTHLAFVMARSRVNVRC